MVTPSVILITPPCSPVPPQDERAPEDISTSTDAHTPTDKGVPFDETASGSGGVVIEDGFPHDNGAVGYPRSTSEITPGLDISTDGSFWYFW